MKDSRPDGRISSLTLLRVHTMLLWMQDIHKPESARLRRHLSAVINFAKFREEKLVAYT